MTKEKDLWVHSYRMPPDSNNSIKMEVGIEDCLHIEFEYNKSKYVPYSSHSLISPVSPLSRTSGFPLLTCLHHSLVAGTT